MKKNILMVSAVLLLGTGFSSEGVAKTTLQDLDPKARTLIDGSTKTKTDIKKCLKEFDQKQKNGTVEVPGRGGPMRLDASSYTLKCLKIMAY